MLQKDSGGERITSGNERAAHHQEDGVWQAPALQVPEVRPHLQGLLPAGGNESVREVQQDTGGDKWPGQLAQNGKNLKRKP